MKHLSYLTPAETLLLIDPENANGVEMLKFTFLDLILKNKLKLFERQVKSDLGKILLYKFIKLGDKFDNNKIRPHEKFFFDLFIEKNTNYFIRNYLTTIFNNAKNEKYFKKKVIENNNLKDCFTQNIIQQLYNGFSINEIGNELSLELRQEIKELKIVFPALLKDNQSQAKKVVQTIGANVFLLKDIDLSILNLIDNDLLIELNNKKDEDNNNDWFLDFFDGMDFGNDNNSSFNDGFDFDFFDD